VDRRNLTMLAALAAIWGSSFLFIKVAVEHIAPESLVFARLVLGFSALAPFVRLRMSFSLAWRSIRGALLPLVVASVLNAALPFWLLSWGETRLDSGLAALIQACTPLFTAVLAFWFVHSERTSGLRLAGVGIGFAGVALLVGGVPHGSVLAALAVVGVGACYSVAALITSQRLRGIPPLVIAFATCGIASLVSLPGGVAQLPDGWPGWKAAGSVVVLGVVGLGVAYILYFALITGPGASYAVLVTYLVPPMALFYGAVFLAEPIGTSALVGLVLILGGVALGSGAGRPARRAVAEPAP
jgi:drug/metabolite transporter (DMT)-like permease